MQDRTTEKEPAPPSAADRAIALHRLSDRELIRRFADQRDEEAFALVVRRHKSMVFSVCRGILRHHQDAEDAFQATFLVLIKKAKRVRWRTSLAGWLHVTACRISLKASARRCREQMQPMDAEPQATDSLREVAAQHTSRTLHEELSRMPERYRAPLALCYLEGCSRSEVAKQLGLKESQVKWRLERGRHELRLRLRRRGVGLALPAVVAGGVLSAGSANAGVVGLGGTLPVPEWLVASTVKAGAKFAADGSLGGAVSAQVLKLSQSRGELTMVSTGSLVKPAALAAAALALLGLGFLFASHDIAAEERPQTHQLEIALPDTHVPDTSTASTPFRLTAAPAGDPGSAGDLSAAQFSLLSEEDQLTHLKEALLEFRRQTANFSATVVNTVMNLEYDQETEEVGRTVLMRGSTYTYDLRRIGDSYRVSRRRKSHGPKEPGVIYDMTDVEGYDAEAGRRKQYTIAPREDAPPLFGGVISPQRSIKIAHGCRFFQYLGDSGICDAGSQFLSFIDDARVTQVDLESGLLRCDVPTSGALSPKVAWYLT